jgi:RND family efflux transporter MFP subunit
VTVRPTRTVPSLSLSSLALIALACAPSGSHGTGAEASESAAHELEPVRQTVFGARFLTYLEHPPLVSGEPAEFLVHLTVLATGAPARAERVVLELGAQRFEADAPRYDGLFVPAGSPSEVGRQPARLRVESGADSETLELTPLGVHASTAEAARAGAAESDASPGPIPFLLEEQWQVRLLLAEAGPRALTERLVVPATLVPREDARASVTAPISGRLQPPEVGALPASGTRIERGALLGWLEPPLDGPARALLLEVAATRLEIERSASDAAATLEFASKARSRLAELLAQGLAAQEELEQAERELAAAAGAARAAAVAVAALERLGDTADGALLRLPLSAPLDGVVLSAPLVAGAHVAAGAEVFQLLDPTRLWVEGRVGEFDLARLPPTPAARATFPALPDLVHELAVPESIAPLVEPGSRTVRVRYALDDAGERLRAGLLAELALALRSVAADVVVPRAAIVHDAGFATAYVMRTGESFERRVLALGLTDGEWVEVRSGLRAGERVAASSAHLLKLAALAPGELGQGHHH